MIVVNCIYVLLFTYVILFEADFQRQISRGVVAPVE